MELDSVVAKAQEARALREEFDILRVRYQEAREKYDRLRTAFIGHYQWLAEAVHQQYHVSQKYDGQLKFMECQDPICHSVRRTIKDLEQIEVDLRENNLVSSERVIGTEAPRSA